MYDFYWYPNCSTCKKAKATLENQGISYRAIDLKSTPPSSEQFQEWFAQADFPVNKFFNTSGLVYRDLKLKDQMATLTDQEKADLLSANGMLVKRPLLVKNGKVEQIGFKAEAYEQIKK